MLDVSSASSRVVITIKQSLHGCYFNWYTDKIRNDFELCMTSSKCWLLLINEFTLDFVFDLWMKWALAQVASHQASSPKSSRESFRSSLKSSLKSLQASRKRVARPKIATRVATRVRVSGSSHHLWHTWSQMVTPLVNRSVDNVLVKVRPSLYQGFRRSSTSWIISYMHCCITPHIQVSLKQMTTLVHLDEAMTHLMQFCLLICRCNVTFSVFWISQGGVATVIRWGGWS